MLFNWTQCVICVCDYNFGVIILERIYEKVAVRMIITSYMVLVRRQESYERRQKKTSNKSELGGFFPPSIGLMVNVEKKVDVTNSYSHWNT